MFFKKKQKAAPAEHEVYRVPVQWGGYYSSKNKEGEYGIFRLVDFNKDAYHIQVYDHHFDHRPTLAEAEKVKPFVWHVPIAVAGIINNKELQLIGHKPLTDEDLQGYIVYLRETGVDQPRIDELCKRVKEMSGSADAMETVFIRDADGSVTLNVGDISIRL